MEITRTTEPRLEAIANSVFLKLIGNVVLLVAPPLILWGMSKILDRLDTIELSVSAYRTTTATTELRLLALEHTRAHERLLKIEFEVEQLKKGR